VNTDKDIAIRFMQALWTADFDAIDQMLSADAKWYFQLGMPQAQEGRGRVWPAREAMRRIVEDLYGKFDPDGFAVTTTRVIADEGSVSIEYEANGRTSAGLPYLNYYVTILTVRDGKVVEIKPFNDTAQMLSMLGS
jgi:ketosteroid isomerase-like protein